MITNYPLACSSVRFERLKVELETEENRRMERFESGTWILLVFSNSSFAIFHASKTDFFRIVANSIPSGRILRSRIFADFLPTPSSQRYSPILFITHRRFLCRDIRKYDFSGKYLSLSDIHECLHDHECFANKCLRILFAFENIFAFYSTCANIFPRIVPL